MTSQPPSPPVAFRLKRPYGDENEFVEGDGHAVHKGGMVLVGAGARPTGLVVRFELALRDGTALFRGEGRVVAHRPYPEAGRPAGLEIKFTRLDPRGKAIVERILRQREAPPSAPPGGIPDLTPAPEPERVARPSAPPPPVVAAEAPPVERAPPSLEPEPPSLEPEPPSIEPEPPSLEPENGDATDCPPPPPEQAAAVAADAELDPSADEVTRLLPRVAPVDDGATVAAPPAAPIFVDVEVDADGSGEDEEGDDRTAIVPAAVLPFAPAEDATAIAPEVAPISVEPDLETATPAPASAAVLAAPASAPEVAPSAPAPISSGVVSLAAPPSDPAAPSAPAVSGEREVLLRRLRERTRGDVSSPDERNELLGRLRARAR